METNIVDKALNWVINFLTFLVIFGGVAFISVIVLVSGIFTLAILGAFAFTLPTPQIIVFVETPVHLLL